MRVMLIGMIILGLCLPASAQSGISHEIELFFEGGNFITAMVFAPDGRLFFTEKETGHVRVVSAEGQLEREPVLSLTTDGMGERGLLGIALDPDYSKNGFIWLHNIAPVYQDEVFLKHQVIRFREENGRGSGAEVLLESPIFTNDGVHYGGGIYFDADGFLYLAVGDHYRAENATDLAAFGGKIHRFSVVDGQSSIPEDNPWEGNSAYAIGLRNPYDLAIDPYGGGIFISENGQQCDDEINLLVAGGDYGWREGYDDVLPICEDDYPEVDFIRPLIHYTPTIAPVGLTVYSGSQLPIFEGMIFFCSWVDGKLRGLSLDESRTKVIYAEEMEIRASACKTAITTGIDGALYYASEKAVYRMVAIQS